jgi:hypothetical protein
MMEDKKMKGLLNNPNALALGPSQSRLFQVKKGVDIRTQKVV